MSNPDWSSPPEWAVGQLVTAADMQLLSDDLNVLRGPPTVHVTHNANQSISDDTDTVLAFNTERQKTDTAFHDNTTNNSRIVIQETGWHFISACVEWASGGTGYRRASVRLNGTTILWRNHVAANNTTTNALAFKRYLTAGDYLEVVVRQTNGGALNVQSSSSYSPDFVVQFVGE